MEIDVLNYVLEDLKNKQYQALKEGDLNEYDLIENEIRKHLASYIE